MKGGFCAAAQLLTSVTGCWIGSNFEANLMGESVDFAKTSSGASPGCAFASGR